MKRVVCLPALGLAMLLAILPLAEAQSIQSSILGNVRDSAGAAVPRAQVTLLNEGTNDERTQATDESGDYRFAGLLAGTYRVSVQAPGFKAQVTRGIVLDMSQVRRVECSRKAFRRPAARSRACGVRQ